MGSLNVCKDKHFYQINVGIVWKREKNDFKIQQEVKKWETFFKIFEKEKK